MYTLMHLSDIHRSEYERISNGELLSSLITDCGRFSTETPPIANPDAIIVSGDLVQGLQLGADDYPAALEAQYKEALEFLVMLADAFFRGDHSKIVIIPGNHDVDWNMALNAMVSAEPPNQNVQILLSDPSSAFRWSWETRQVLRIADSVAYQNRFKYFCEFYRMFYQGVTHSFELDPSRPWNLFELDNGKIGICGFNSCANNDCYNLIAEIPAGAISQSHLELVSSERDHLLRIALWHHDADGHPRRSDYMDMNTIRLMIDRGYRLGLHGHQHKSNASVCSLHTFGDHRMAIVGAGSLCAGPSQLPSGFRRQYNVVEIFDNYLGCRVHSREMVIPGVFVRGRFYDTLGSYADLSWTPAPTLFPINMALGDRRAIATVEKAEQLLASGAYEDAASLIIQMEATASPYGRQLLSEALFRGKMWERLEEHLSSPRNDDELVKLAFAGISLKHFDTVESALRSAEKSGDFADVTITELRNRLNAEKGMST